MVTVWVLSQHIDFEGGYVLAVYKSEDIALSEMRRYAVNDNPTINNTIPTQVGPYIWRLRTSRSDYLIVEAFHVMERQDEQ